ncbi:hypothetical protein ACF0H5_005061 [Mactra antiquata]
MKIYEPTFDKTTRIFAYKSFSLLQNSVSIAEACSVFSDMCSVFTCKNLSMRVKDSHRNLLKKIKNIEELDDEVTEFDDSEELHTTETTTIDHGTIKDSSPFHIIFKSIHEANLEENSDDSEEKNTLFCPNIIQCLLDKFLYIFPMWSGVMLSLSGCNITRDTNANVESWFNIVKSVCKTKNRRPSAFVLNYHRLISARIAEIKYPGGRKRKSKTNRKRPNEENLSQAEELWVRKKKKTPRYIPKSQKQEQFPEVAKWGGHAEGQSLSNTCTIDNGLTILHLKYSEDQKFRKHLQQQNGDLCSNLLTIFTLMTEKCFSAAKVMWTNFTNLKSGEIQKNLHGDEAEMFFSFFETEWRSKIRSTCSNENCPRRVHDTRTLHGCMKSSEDPISSIQQLIDNWIKFEGPCWFSREIDSPQEDTIVTDKVHVCQGRRSSIRCIEGYSPVLIVRVYEHFLADNLVLDTILDSQKVIVNDKSFSLGGVTMHKENHYAAVVNSVKHGKLWYDGLVGKLETMPRNSSSWAPSHVIYCQD